MNGLKEYDQVKTLVDKTECGDFFPKGTEGMILEMKDGEDGHKLYLLEIILDKTYLVGYEGSELAKV